MNILIAEDNQIQQRILSAFFTQHLKIKPFIKENGQVALDFIQHNKDKKIDLIFTDFKMPVMDGIAFCKELRKTDTLTPIVLMTAQYERCHDIQYAGINEIIMKPYKLYSLADIIFRHCNSIDYPMN